MNTFLFDTDKKKAKKNLDIVHDIKGRLINKGLLLSVMNQPNAVHVILSASKFGKTDTVGSVMTQQEIGQEQVQKKIAQTMPDCAYRV